MTRQALQATDRPLVDQHDVGLLDLDGVVYVGADAVPDVAKIIATATESGMRFGYVTNNASRTPHEVGEHLRHLGIPTLDDEVITSSQAASRVLASRLATGSPVLVVGTAALAAEVENVGLRAVWSAADQPLGVVQGYNPELSWSMLAEACVAVRAGAFWVATNTDSTLPSPRGPLPGNGSFVQVVAQTTGGTPVVAGKPEPAMHTECVLRTGARRPLVVGDRLDTDIEGAQRADVPSLLVLTGVARAADLLAAPPAQRPTYLGADLGGILLSQPGIERSDGLARCENWLVQERDGSLHLTWARDGGSAAAAPASEQAAVDCAALRAVAVLAWDVGTTHTVAGDNAASGALTRLGLAAG
ncbi:MAG: HAD-IIA family hydrolase [Geodermatophilaceae bacterium]|nr:HAD-IIA family hydrolase [Geodermatophilaceae bacterium]